MLGRAVVGAAEAAGHDVAALTRPQLDVTDPDAVARAFTRARPEAVVNCAAYTDVDGAEDAPEDALRLNGEAAGIVAAAAASERAAVLYPSSDYVFDGEKRTPYVEADPVGPISSYGRSKLAGEQATAEGNERHYSVRTSWLFGPGGRNFVDTMLALGRERDEVRVVSDQVGCPTYTGHLAEGLLALLDTEAYGMHHMVAAEQCSWAEFAAAIFEDAGVDCRVTPVTSEEFPRPAPRPAYSVLRSERGAPELPAWREGLRAYLGHEVPA